MNAPLAIARRTLVAAVCLMAFATAAMTLADEPTPAPNFNRDIRPILANHCFHCHGPDDQERKAGLRLDLAEALVKPAESGQAAIVPGQPDKSELVRRIEATDDAERMPPVDSNKVLSDREKSLLRQWIAAGAKVESHWSLVPPRAPALPQVANAAWCQNPIDRFVLSALERENLRPAPKADRLTLVRRVYLDLIGLPPTPAEADAFSNDTRPDAYEQLVERLLASPHYGERWARVWLDLARYADTNGYEKDRNRSIWPYRDWVIRSLNADLPFDRFTIAQIAGDMLPNADLDSRIATGFHRNTMVNEEGGIDVEEFRFYSVVDRVNTTAVAWLGLTLGCAQCHTHKFDPFTQTEYYQLFALLNNADEPELAIANREVAAERASIEAKIAALAAERQQRWDAGKFDGWRRTAESDARKWLSVAPQRVVSTGGATMNVLPDRSVLATGDKPNQDTYHFEWPAGTAPITAIRLEVLPHESLPEGGPGRAPLFSEGDFMLGELTLALVKSEGEPQPIKLTAASHSFASDKSSAAATIDGDLDTGWSIKGRTGQPHQAVFQLAEPLSVPPGTVLRLTLDQRYIHQTTIGRFRVSTASHAGAKAAAVPAEIEEILCLPALERGEVRDQQLRDYYLTVGSEFAKLNTQIAKLRAGMPRHPTTLVMAERSSEHARTTRLAHRGEFLSPRDPVQPGVPTVLHPLPAGAPRNRLGLAHWLVDTRNPLIGRVVMNRHWQQFFGRGLVRTVEDFGLRGEAPSHPELLDYLATQFVEGGWSTKAMHRLIATSATYQQSANGTDESRQRDPQNVWLSRGSRLRIDAETMRDTALTASGLLTPALGGPSVFPPQPAGATDLAYSKGGWTTSQGAARYRRGLYTFSKRTSPYAAFTTFDAPSGETCAARRERSNTPLQALTVLNDTVFVESAQALAARVLQGTGTDDDRCTHMFRACLTRTPTADELADLRGFVAEQRSRLSQGQLDALAISGAEATNPAARELAAWTLLARAVLNLDEFITRQ